MWSFKKNIYRTRREDEVTCPDCVPNDVIIGTQTWTGCNADTEFYRNGDPIPYEPSVINWQSLTTGAWCWPRDVFGDVYTFGKLYNWHAVNDPRGIAPTGYHVPSDSEWTILSNYLGGDTVAGGKIKKSEIDSCNWRAPNTGATNSSNFSGLPAGIRGSDGIIGFVGSNGLWWSSTELTTTNAWLRFVETLTDNINKAGENKKTGLSLRFIKDEVVPCVDCVYNEVNINGQIWVGCNANTEFYRNGDSIPQVTDPTIWGTLTTGAWCWYNNDPANEAPYGKLYNWHAVNDPRELAPLGYHVATDAEWTTLTTFLGGDAIAGGELKETGSCHWNTPNIDATNSVGFSAIGGGYRNDNTSGFFYLKTNGYYWTGTPNGTGGAFNRFLYNYNGTITRNTTSRSEGYSVRFIKD